MATITISFNPAPDPAGESFIFVKRIEGLACRDRVVVILRDCGSLELGSNPGPGPYLLVSFK
jgi:hypothetical protein